MSIAESGLRGRIIKVLRERGCLVDGNPAGPSTGRGRSDLTVCAQGIFIALEVKAPGEPPTPPQIRYLRQVRQAGGVAAVVHSPKEALEIVDKATHSPWVRQHTHQEALDQRVE